MSQDDTWQFVFVGGQSCERRHSHPGATGGASFGFQHFLFLPPFLVLVLKKDLHWHPGHFWL